MRGLARRALEIVAAAGVPAPAAGAPQPLGSSPALVARMDEGACAAGVLSHCQNTCMPEFISPAAVVMGIDWRDHWALEVRAPLHTLLLHMYVVIDPFETSSYGGQAMQRLNTCHLRSLPMCRGSPATTALGSLHMSLLHGSCAAQ